MGLPKVGVEAVVEGIDSYGKDIKAMQDANDAAGNSVKKTAKDFDSLGKSTNSLGSIFDVAFGTIIANAATKAFDVISGVVGGILNTIGNLSKGIFDSTVTFSQTMANISAVTGKTGKDLKEINDQILAVGAESAAGPQKVADAYYDIASGVLDASQRLDTLKAAVAASEAGQADLAATTGFLIAEMNAYGDAAGGAAHVSDVLTETVGKGVGKMDQFVAAMTPIAGLAASQKISIDELGGAISYMTAKGVPAEQAATQLKAAITQLSRNTPQATRAIKAMGEKSIEASIAQHGLSGTLDLLQQGAKKTGQNFTQMIGSVEALQAATVLGGDDFAQYFKEFETGVDGATAAAQKLQQADVSYQLKLIGSRFQAIGIMVGEAVLPAFNKFLTFLNTELAKLDWKAIGAGLDKIGESLGTAAGKIIDGLGKWLGTQDWNKIGTDIQNGLKDVGDFIDKIPWDDIVTGAGNVVTGIGNIVTKIGEVGTAINELPKQFAIAAINAKNSIQPLLDAIETINKFLHPGDKGPPVKPTTVLPGAGNDTSGLPGMGSTQGGATAAELNNFQRQSLTMPGVSGVPSDVLQEVGALGRLTKPIQVPTELAPPSNVTTYGDIFTGNNIVKPVGIPAELKQPDNVGVTLGNVDVQLGQGPKVQIPTELKPIDYGAFAADVAANADLLKTAGMTIPTNIAAGVQSASPKVNHELGQAMSGALSGGRAAAASAPEIGAGITAGIAAAIKGSGGSVVGALSGVIAEAIAAAKSQLAMHSPSKVFMEMGNNMMTGWQMGIEQYGKLPSIAVADAASMATAAAMPIPLGGAGGNTYNDTRNNTSIYNLGLQPHQSQNEKGAATLQSLRG